MEPDDARKRRTRYSLRTHHAGRGRCYRYLRIRPVPGKERNAVKAFEIREFALKSKGTSEECVVLLLGEIAAQLAQLNDGLDQLSYGCGYGPELHVTVRTEASNGN